MIGAIAGDIIGSVYENEPIKSKEFLLVRNDSRFTDDSVLTVAVANAIITGETYCQSIWDIGGRYPNAGYGASFIHWLKSANPAPYNSWGNGAAMRVSPIAYAFESVERVLEEAKKSAEISHNHVEGIKGAQAVALSVYLARTGHSKLEMKDIITEITGYNLEQTLSEIRPKYRFDVSSQGSVPQAIISFMESTSFEDAVRNAVSLGGDSDTQACMAGAIAEAYYDEGVPENIIETVKAKLSSELWSITEKYCSMYCPENL